MDGVGRTNKPRAEANERASERAEIIGRRDEDDDDDDEDISDDEVRRGWSSVHCEGGLSRFIREQLNERGPLLYPYNLYNWREILREETHFRICFRKRVGGQWICLAF